MSAFDEAEQGGGSCPERSLELGLETTRVWTEAELGAVLEDQLMSPVQFDLGAMDIGNAGRLRELSMEDGLLLASLRGLFQHDRPPLELLDLTKGFAKSCLQAADPPVPREVARVIYYLSIATAMYRLSHRISTLDDRALRKGFEWAGRQAWVDSGSKQCFRRAIEKLDETGGGG